MQKTALKTGCNEKSYIFQEIGISETYVRLFENFQNLIALQVWCLAFTKNLERLANETVLGQSKPNGSGGKVCKKSLIISHVEDIFTLSKGYS